MAEGETDPWPCMGHFRDAVFPGALSQATGDEQVTFTQFEGT
jgi:hypothetical protein